jgi:hypothetical protein
MTPELPDFSREYRPDGSSNGSGLSGLPSGSHPGTSPHPRPVAPLPVSVPRALLSGVAWALLWTGLNAAVTLAGLFVLPVVLGMFAPSGGTFYLTDRVPRSYLGVGMLVALVAGAGGGITLLLHRLWEDRVLTADADRSRPVVAERVRHARSLPSLLLWIGFLTGVVMAPLGVIALIAALGTGWPPATLISLGMIVVGGGLIALTRTRRAHVREDWEQRWPQITERWPRTSSQVKAISAARDSRGSATVSRLAGISAALAIGCLIWFAIAAGSGFDLARSAGLPEWVAPLPIGAVFIAIAVAAGALGAFVSTLRRLRDYRAFEQDAQAAAREITAGDRTPVAAGREILSPHPVRSPAILLALLAGQLITFAFTPRMTASQWGTDYLDVIEGWQALLVPGLALLVLSAALLALSAHRIGPHRARILAAFPDIDPVPALYTTSDSEGRTVSHRVVEGDGRPIRVQADQVNEDPR